MFCYSVRKQVAAMRLVLAQRQHRRSSEPVREQSASENLCGFD
jgi:hypothetical protein